MLNINERLNPEALEVGRLKAALERAEHDTKCAQQEVEHLQKSREDWTSQFFAADKRSSQQSLEIVRLQLQLESHKKDRHFLTVLFVGTLVIAMIQAVALNSSL
jgi:hypothetical protein